MARQRRSPNEGSIRQRKDRPGFEVRLYVDGRRRSWFARSYAEAREIRARKAVQKHDGSIAKGDRRNLGAFLHDWLKDSVAPSVAPLTLQQYEQHVRLYLAPARDKDGIRHYRPLPALGAMKLTKLAPSHVQQFINAQVRKGLSPRTVELSVVILRAALGYALVEGLIARNVAKLVKPPTVKRQPVTPLTPEQTKAFLEVINDERFEAAYITAIAMGLRRGEILGLRWKDVDFDDRMLTVTQALQRVNGPDCKSTLQLAPLKSYASADRLPLPDFVIKGLRARRAAQAQERLVAGADWQDLGLVFTTRRGTPVEPRRLHRDFKQLLAKAGFPLSTRLHDLRHGIASLLIATGEHPRVVMAWMRHSQISVTMNTYAHVMPTMLREVAEKIDAALSSPR